jgi:hypothetical protein
MIDVAGEIAPGRAVDGPAAVDLEQIFVGAAAVDFLRDLGRDAAADIFDDQLALRNVLRGEQAEPGLGAADTIKRRLGLRPGVGGDRVLGHRANQRRGA